MTFSHRVKRTGAIAAAAMMGLGLALTAPLAASAATTTYNLDCENLPDYSDQTFYVAPGGTITFNLSNFDAIVEYSGSVEPAPIAGVPAATIVADAGDDFELSDSVCINTFWVAVEEAPLETTPSGSLLFSPNVTITGDKELTVTDNTGDDDHMFGGDDNCNVSTYESGKHVYQTLDFTVLTAGSFTLRGVSTNPLGYYNSLSEYDPIGDPSVVVYSTFDPANPDAGVVACNDDLNDIGDQNDAESTADSRIIEGHISHVAATLQPGHYTLVLMTYDDLSIFEFNDGYNEYEGSDFVVGPKTVSFEIWGPSGSLVLGHTALLAATGVDTSYAGIGIVVALLGFGMLVITRRRRASTR